MKQKNNVVITIVVAVAAVSLLFVCFGKDMIAKYALTFDSQDGTNIDSIVGVTESLIKAPADPTKKGCTFTSWSIKIINHLTLVRCPKKIRSLLPLGK